MNTTDRSLTQIDYALRRRFFFYRLMPVVRSVAPVLDAWLSAKGIEPAHHDRLLRLFLALNDRITRELGEHFQLGHSYFMRPGIDEPQVLHQVWQRSVMPLLEEYFHNRRNLTEFLSEFAIERLVTDADVSS
jgi:5-methylcytosine-specific restriction protein B